MLATVLPLAAAFNAALLAAALTHRAWTKRARAGLYAAAFLFSAAAAVTLITFDHAGAPIDPAWGAFAEGLLTLSAGPLLFLFVASLLGMRANAWLCFIPVALFTAASAIAPAWVADAFVVERLIFVQMAFTAAAGVVALRHQPAGRRGQRARGLALIAVGAVGALHLAQLARMSWSDVPALTNIVPLVGGAAFLAATAAVYFGGRMSAFESLIDVPPAADAHDRSLVSALDAAFSAGLLREPDLSIARTATKLAASSDQLAHALAAVCGMSFSEYVQERRVEHAKRLLADPAEARTSMEAIGLLSGFGSRSAFYKAFGERAGMTPAAFRAHAHENPVQIPESGQTQT